MKVPPRIIHLIRASLSYATPRGTGALTAQVKVFVAQPHSNLTCHAHVDPLMGHGLGALT